MFTRRNSNMKKLKFIVSLLLAALPVFAQTPVPPVASQAEVNAGVDNRKIVTAKTLAGYALLQSTGSISSATATNIAAYQAAIADTPMSNILRSATIASNVLANLYANSADNVVSNALIAYSQPLDSDLSAIAALGDPNADRLLFWDDSASAFKYLSLGTGLSISGTTITASGGGGGGTGMQNPATADFDVANYSLLNVDTIYGNDAAHGSDLSLHSYDSDASIKLYTFDSGSGIQYASQNGHTFTGPVTFNDGVTSGGTWSIANVVAESITGNGSGITNLNSSVINYPTNSGAAVSPNMLIAYALLSTNNAFAMLPPANVDIYQTNVQTSVLLVTNTTAAAKAITAPAPIKLTGVAYVTNVTIVSTTVYPKVVTNMVCLPIW